MAQVLFFVANVLLQVAVDLGYGTGMEAEIPAGQRAAMELARTCGQMMASITTAVAKAAVGVFLLRLATEPWQRCFIWATLVIFTFISTGKQASHAKCWSNQGQQAHRAVPVSAGDYRLGGLQTNSPCLGRPDSGHLYGYCAISDPLGR